MKPPVHLNEYLTLLDGPPDPDDHFLAYAQGDHRKALTEWRALPADRRSRLRQSVGDEALYVGFQTATWRRIRADCQASFRQPPPGTGPRRHAAPRVP